MNRKSIVFLFLTTLVLSSCSDNDKKKNKNDDPNKITSITCTVSGSSGDGFTANFRYDANTKKLSNVLIGNQNESYTHTNNQISVYSAFGSTINETIRYTLSGDRITKKEYREVEGNEEYTSETISYEYNSNYCTKATDDDLSYVFSWKNGNVELYEENYSYSQTDKMAFEYSNREQPKNFPFRLVTSFNPVEFENFHPVNFYYGYMNKYLVEKAEYYELPDKENILVRYEFDYKSWDTEGNIITMEITKTELDEEDPIVTIFKYTFEYNYDPN